jgi:kinesin family member 11
VTHSDIIASNTDKLSAMLQEFIKHSSQCTHKIRTEAAQLQQKELATLNAHSERIDAQLQRIQEALVVMQECDGNSDEAVATLHTIVKDSHESSKSGFDAWSQSLKKSHEIVCRDVETNYTTTFSAVEKALKTLGSIVESLVRETQSHIEEERVSMQQVNALADSTINDELIRLRQQNEMLTRLLETERAQGEKAKDELIQRVSGLLGDFTKERDRSLAQAVVCVQGSNNKAEEGMRSFGDAFAQLTTIMGKRRDKTIGVLERRSGENKRTRDGALKVSVSGTLNRLYANWLVRRSAQQKRLLMRHLKAYKVPFQTHCRPDRPKSISRSRMRMQAIRMVGCRHYPGVFGR